MRREFESPEQMDLSQPSPDFASNRNLEQFKPRIRPLARAGLALTLLLGATGTSVVSGSSGDKISKELNSTATRTSLVTDVPLPERTPFASKPATLTPEDELINNGEFISPPSFETLVEAQTFLEGEKGAKWLSGNPAKEIELFPWNSMETWRMFSNLRSIGIEPHFVFLVPHTDNKKFSVIGIENIGGNITLDYIDYDGNPRTISYKGPLDLKDLLGADFEKLFENNIVVWSDISYPNANSNGGLCTNRFRNPVPGITDGFACSIDGKLGHYFQSQNIVPENFK